MWRWIAGIYFLMSVITFVTYGIDKRRAARGRWHVRESRLHLLELLGGWPGAVAGQVIFRHKRRKLVYMAVFVLIVALHAGLWLWWVCRFGWP